MPWLATLEIMRTVTKECNPLCFSICVLVYDEALFIEKNALFSPTKIESFIYVTYDVLSSYY
jgi:hypothetical protein